MTRVDIVYKPQQPLYLIEIQGTLCLPPEHAQKRTHIGELQVHGRTDGDHTEARSADDATKLRMMGGSKAVMLVGHQQMMGQVVDLPQPLGVLRKEAASSSELQIIDVIRQKIVFSSRPEPRQESG